MSYVVLGTDVLEDDALVVVTTVGGVLSATYTRPVAEADLERYATDDVELVELRVQRLANLDASHFPPVTPFIGRLEHGKLVELRAPACMTEEGQAWLATLAIREDLPLELPPATRDHIRSFRMPADLDRDVTRLARARGMTFSDAVREGLRMIGVLPRRKGSAHD